MKLILIFSASPVSESALIDGSAWAFSVCPPDKEFGAFVFDWLGFKLRPSQ
jgi:hypothetical protein